MAWRHPGAVIEQSPISLPLAFQIRRGVARLLDSLGYAAYSEFTLNNGRRADLVAVNPRGRILIVEIKSCRADFVGDRKWQDYVEYCDGFYFAVEAGFPAPILPAETGLIIADGHGGSIVREAPETPVNSNRRRAMILDLALAASRRLQRLEDPELD